MSETWKDRIGDWLRSHREDGVRLLREMVQLPSRMGGEAPIQRLVAAKLGELGMEVDMWEPDGARLRTHPFFYATRTDFSGSPNVVGVRRGIGGGRSILLNGHVDVVPEGDRSQWQDDPFSAAIRDGRMYGRGVTDMKGGNVSMLLALQAIQELNVPLLGDVIFESVVEEESGGAGTLAAVVRGYTADVALIPEPTNMRIFPKQQGSLWFRLTVKGRSAHGGTRYEGVSAIEKSLAVLTHILALEKKRNGRIEDPLYRNAPIPVPINVGSIQGGTWPSSVPDEVKLEGRMGVAPDETMEAAQAEMAQWLARLAEDDDWFARHPVELEWFGARWLPGSVDPGHDFMQVLTEQYRHVTDRPPVIEASPWGTDGGMLAHAGGTPTVVFGPGVTEVAHYPNEYIELNKVFEAAHIIALAIIRWCGVQG